MSNDHLLQPLQFHLQSGSADYHLLHAVHPDKGVVGSMAWAKKDTGFHQQGEISRLDSQKERQGIATAMYHHAVSSGIEPKPLHSHDQTPAGKAWAKKVGGDYAPRRYVNGPKA